MPGLPATRGRPIDWRAVEEIDLAAQQRVVGGRRVRHHHQLDAIDLHHLAAGEAAGGLLARHVAGEAVVDERRSRPIFVAVLKRNGPEPTISLIGVYGIGERLLLAHDRAGDAVAAAEQELDVVEPLLQREREAAVVDTVHPGDQAGEDLVLRVADEHAPQRGDDVARRDRGAVVEGEAGAQREACRRARRRDLLQLSTICGRGTMSASQLNSVS